jgi:hypothetical protein
MIAFEALKYKFFIPPVVSLLVVCSWIGSECLSISTLEQESATLKKHLAARSSGSGQDDASSKQLFEDKLTKEPIDWKKVSAQVTERQNRGGMGGMTEMRTSMRIQQKLDALSKKELISAFDEIAALDLPDESRRLLQQMLFDPLCQKDPAAALTRYLDRIDDREGMMGMQLNNAIREWSHENPAAANAWFDQQIAAGKFDIKALDGKNRTRKKFESPLIRALISTDPAAAATRLKSLPEDQCVEFLCGQLSDLKDKDQLAYANLVRSRLPQETQARALTCQIHNQVNGEGYTQVTEYMDRIKATPVERTVCIEQAAKDKILLLSMNRKVTRDDLNAMREWANSQALKTTDKLTGYVLATAIRADGKLDFSEAAALASQYHEASGNDDVLIGFLAEYEPSRDHSEEEGRVLAEKISDQKKREEILRRYQ